MKRMHVHVGVKDLGASIEFYSALFAARPTVEKADYAKWSLDDPHLNFAISHDRAQLGVAHLGVETDSPDELDEVYKRLEAAEGPVLEEGETTCCYARSRKSWITDPDGVAWETFHTIGSVTTYGAGRPAMA